MSVSVLNWAGVRSTYVWTFTVAVAPTVGTMAPADGSVVSIQQPTISAVVNTNGLVLSSYEMKVDGSIVAATWNPTTGILSYTPSANLRNDAVHAVSLTATTSGGSVAVAWSFGVQIYPDMAVNMGCVECHPTYPAMHPMTNCDNCHGYDGPIGGFYAPPDYHPDGEAAQLLTDCTYCHGSNIYPTVPNHGDLSLAHGSTTDMTGCACHVRNITIEHNRWTDETGGALSCASCHGASASQQVKDAMAAGSTNCLACHTISPDHPYADVDHAADVENIANPTGFACGDCHSMELAAEHGKASSSSSTNADVCATCHPDPRASFETWDDSCSQGACHATAVHGNEASAHAFADPGASCLSSGCHAGKADLTAMHSDAETTTPDGTRTSCLVCHASGVPTTKVCADCHPDRTQPHGYDAPMHTPTSATSMGCQVVGCHPSTDIGPLHAGLPQGPCAVCHANSTRGDLTAGKTSANCEGCHVTEKQDYHTGMDAAHQAPVSDYETCGHCHHQWGNPAVGPSLTRHATCAECHNGTFDLTGKTATCSSCHTTEGAGGTAPAYYHRETVAWHSPQDTASLDCARCHDTTNVRVLHAGTPDGCGTCHQTKGCTRVPLHAQPGQRDRAHAQRVVLAVS